MYEDNSPIGSLVHLFIDGAFSRRELVERVARHTGSVAAAIAALAGFEELKAQAPPPVSPGVRVAEDDPDIEARTVTFPGLAGPVFGYLAFPRKRPSSPSPPSRRRPITAPARWTAATTCWPASTSSNASPTSSSTASA
jgi:hypothetical protein